MYVIFICFLCLYCRYEGALELFLDVVDYTKQLPKVCTHSHSFRRCALFRNPTTVSALPPPPPPFLASTPSNFLRCIAQPRGFLCRFILVIPSDESSVLGIYFLQCRELLPQTRVRELFPPRHLLTPAGYLPDKSAACRVYNAVLLR